MRTTIDKAGRLVIPKQLRDEVGIVPGDIEVSVDGAAVRVEAVAGTEVVRRNGRLIIPARGGPKLDDEAVRRLRDAGRR